ncbi:deoxyribonuclease-1-like isoform X2 [Littorina saxatilis]
MQENCASLSLYNKTGQNPSHSTSACREVNTHTTKRAMIRIVSQIVSLVLLMVILTEGNPQQVIDASGQCHCPCECSAQHRPLFQVSARGSAATGRNASTSTSSRRLKIGAFNIKTFGRSKMSKPGVPQRIKQIIERYDVILVQEILDRSGESVRQLHRMLSRTYEFVISDRLGRGRYKEQYAFFYRTDRVSLLNFHQSTDREDAFEREPFSVLVAPKQINNVKLALIGFHAKPTDAVKEIGRLADVIGEVRRQFGADVEPIVLGDLNADCDYADRRRRLRAGDALTTNTSYVWLIGDDVDTTTRDSTSCAYDRIIVGSGLTGRVVRGSASVFDFCDNMRLSKQQ